MGDPPHTHTPTLAPPQILLPGNNFIPFKVFVREIVSNSSDALEKMRHRQLTAGFELRNAELPLEIRIWTDPEEGTFTIQDTGIGMSKEEMVTNLGTIVRKNTTNNEAAFLYGKQHHHE